MYNRMWVPPIMHGNFVTQAHVRSQSSVGPCCRVKRKRAMSPNKPGLLAELSEVKLAMSR